MRTPEKEPIDALFDKLGDHVIEPDNSQIEKMKISLESMRFYRFSLRYFNVYYMGIIATSIVLSLWAFADRFLESNARRNTVYITTDTVYIRDTTIHFSSNAEEVSSTNVEETSNAVERKEKKPTVKNSEPPHKENRLVSSKKNTKDSTQLLLPDEGKAKEETPVRPLKTDSVAVPKKALPKKIIYINKKDTIFKFDTTKVVKKK